MDMNWCVPCRHQAVVRWSRANLKRGRGRKYCSSQQQQHKIEHQMSPQIQQSRDYDTRSTERGALYPDTHETKDRFAQLLQQQQGQVLLATTLLLHIQIESALVSTPRNRMKVLHSALVVVLLNRTSYVRYRKREGVKRPFCNGLLALTGLMGDSRERDGPCCFHICQ